MKSKLLKKRVKRKEESVMIRIKAKDFLSIPNILSYLRVILIFLFMFVYRQEIEYKSLYLGTILICSGISDALDGYIARKFNMVTELGKCLDPIADKLTQFVLLVCLLSKYSIDKLIMPFEPTKSEQVKFEGLARQYRNIPKEKEADDFAYANMRQAIEKIVEYLKVNKEETQA